MALEAQNNPFTSILMVEAADPEAIGDADPAAGQRRLIVGDDGLFYMLDSTGTATAVGGSGGDITTDAAWAAKGDLIVGLANDSAGIKTVGANDTVLMADSAATGGVKWVASQTPSTQAFSDAAAEGTADTYARGDHKHAMPASPGGGSGSLVLLEQHTASSSATLDFTAFISSTYDTYQIIGTDLAPATNGANLIMRMGTGGGPTYDSAANYEWGIAAVNNASAVIGTSGTGDTAAVIMDGIANNAGYGFGGFEMLVHNLQSTAHRKAGHYTATWTTSAPTLRFGHGGWFWVTTGTAVTAVRFLMHTGNIASGTIRIYGVAK